MKELYNIYRQIKRPSFRYVLQSATTWISDSGWRQKEQSEVAERPHEWRFFILESVLLSYLMVKLKIFADSLLCVLDHSELSFWKECLWRNDIMNPFDGNWVWRLQMCSARMDFKICFVFL